MLDTEADIITKIKVRCSSQAREEHVMTRGQGPRAERLSGTNSTEKNAKIITKGRVLKVGLQINVLCYFGRCNIIWEKKLRP